MNLHSLTLSRWCSTSVREDVHRKCKVYFCVHTPDDPLCSHSPLLPYCFEDTSSVVPLQNDRRSTRVRLEIQ